MATRTITITETAYERLTREKRPGESFTDVIVRITERPLLRDLHRLLPAGAADAIADAVESSRQERFDRRARRLGERP